MVMSMSFALLPIILLVLAIVVGAIIAFVLIEGGGSSRGSRQTLTVGATLKMKKKMLLPNMIHALSFFFITDGGDLVEVDVEDSLTFDTYNEGDVGVLTYKGRKMMRFERTHVNLQ